MMEKQIKIILLDIDDTIFNTQKLQQSELTEFAMYEEVHEALEQLAQVANLGIFSQGTIAFQLKKLDETNIRHFFTEEHTHIVENKIESIKELLQTYKNRGKLYLVEDRLDVLQMAKQTDPNLVTIWMKRGRYVENQRVVVDYIPDAIAKSLHDVIPLIRDA